MGKKLADTKKPTTVGIVSISTNNISIMQLLALSGQTEIIIFISLSATFSAKQVLVFMFQTQSTRHDLFITFI